MQNNIVVILANFLKILKGECFVKRTIIIYYVCALYFAILCMEVVGCFALLQLLIVKNILNSWFKKEMSGSTKRIVFFSTK